MTDLPVGVRELADGLVELGWVSDLWIAGSLASGDYVPGVSDVDLVALADVPLGADRVAVLDALHRRVDAGAGAGADIGCCYVPVGALGRLDVVHPTWTHGRMVRRVLSGVTRAELVSFGIAVFGRSPGDVLPAVSPDEVRAAARAEIVGPWAAATRWPPAWLDPVFAELALTAMARGRHGLLAGELLPKSAAIERSATPDWLVAQMRARRAGQEVRARRLRTAVIAWRDVRRTTRLAGRVGNRRDDS